MSEKVRQCIRAYLDYREATLWNDIQEKAELYIELYRVLSRDEQDIVTLVKGAYALGVKHGKRLK